MDSERLDLAVVIPAYQAEETITGAIASALESGAAEVIVVDDGSTDSTAAVAVLAGAQCIVQENAGAARSRERGALEATNKYIVFLDADDRLIPDGVRRSVEVLEKDPAIVVAAGVVVAMGAQGRRFPIRYSPVDSSSLLREGFGPWPPAAAVVRSEAYFRAKELPVSSLSPRYAEDYELLIRLSIVGQIDVRDDPTCRYNLVGGKSVRSALSAIESKELIRRHYADYLGLSIQTMSTTEMKMAAAVRIARAKRADGDFLGMSIELVRWAAMNPLAAMRKLGTNPWVRN